MELAKKECILNAAIKAFARMGFKKAAVEEIAREAGVAKGTIYLAAESKEDLFFQAVHRQLCDWTAQVSKMVDPRMPADVIIGISAQASLEYLDSHPLVRDLFLGIYHGQLPGWGAKFEELKEMGQGVVREILKLGMKQGVFRKDLDVDQVAAIIHDGQIATYMIQSRLGEGAAEKMAPRLIAGLDLILHGLKPHPEAAVRSAKPEVRT